MPRASPGVTVELQHRGLQEQLEALAAGEIDLGCTFRAMPDPRPGLEIRRLAPRPLYAWVGADHPLARVRSTTFDALRAHRWVALSERAEPGFAGFVALRGGPGVAPPIEVDALDAAFELVRRGLAVTIVPDAAVVPRGVRRLALPATFLAALG